MAEELKTAETTETKTDVLAEDTEGDADLSENGGEVEFSDSAEGNGGRPEVKQHITENDIINAQNAHRRREAERAKELKKARIDAIIEAVGVNPYTGEELKDADDVEEYLAMNEIKRDGGDPLGDYAKYQKKKVRDSRAAEEAKENEREWYKNDRESFIKKYPDVDIEKLVSDKSFAEYAEGKVGQKPLTEIYEGYERFVKAAGKKAEQKAAQALANSKASPGALSGGGAPQSDFFTYEQVRAMSDAEVRKNYDKIRESMRSWKK